jgi:hypothetical protein
VQACNGMSVQALVHFHEQNGCPGACCALLFIAKVVVWCGIEQPPSPLVCQQRAVGQLLRISVSPRLLAGCKCLQQRMRLRSVQGLLSACRLAPLHKWRLLGSLCVVCVTQQ